MLSQESSTTCSVKRAAPHAQLREQPNMLSRESSTTCSVERAAPHAQLREQHHMLSQESSTTCSVERAAPHAQSREHTHAQSKEQTHALLREQHHMLSREILGLNFVFVFQTVGFVHCTLVQFTQLYGHRQCSSSLSCMTIDNAPVHSAVWP